MWIWQAYACYTEAWYIFRALSRFFPHDQIVSYVVSLFSQHIYGSYLSQYPVHDFMFLALPISDVLSPMQRSPVCRLKSTTAYLGPRRRTRLLFDSYSLCTVYLCRLARYSSSVIVCFLPFARVVTGYGFRIVVLAVRIGDSGSLIDLRHLESTLALESISCFSGEALFSRIEVFRLFWFP